MRAMTFAAAEGPAERAGGIVAAGSRKSPPAVKSSSSGVADAQSGTGAGAWKGGRPNITATGRSGFAAAAAGPAGNTGRLSSGEVLQTARRDRTQLAAA